MAEKKVDAFDLSGIKLLVELMKDNNLSELNLEQGDCRLSLKRAIETPDAPVVVTRAAAPQQPAPAPVAAEPAPAPVNANLKTISSPMVGTFYAAPSPDAAPFVKVGDFVSPDKTVCIIEAMKIFNDIPAEISGKIVEILVKSGDPVEFGAPLFKVEAQ